jgi:hypothetical protein
MRYMKKAGTGLVLIALAFTACKSKDEAITRSQEQAKVDSMVALKVEEVNRLAMEDLDRRMSIEVKAKADSIVAAHMQSQPSTPAQ